MKQYGFYDDFPPMNDGYGGKGDFKPCAHSHKPLSLGGGLVVHGGSARDPLRKDHDIYVSLDGYFGGLPTAHPWNNQITIGFPITDMQAPSDPDEFKKMIAWLVENIKGGKSVHVGCIGGHGRTGTVLCALVKEIMGEVDAITYVRKHYCSKAVETSVQIKFLATHFGIKSVAGSKAHKTYDWGLPRKGTGAGAKYNSRMNDYFSPKEKDAVPGDATVKVVPVAVKGSVWG